LQLLDFMPPAPLDWCCRHYIFMCASMCMSGCVIKLCGHDIFSCWRNFRKVTVLVHSGTKMNWLDFGVKKSKGYDQTRYVVKAAVYASTAPCRVLSSLLNVHLRCAYMQS